MSDNEVDKKEKHLKPYQQLAKDRYTDCKTQIPIPNMSYKDIIPFISILGPPNSGQTILYNNITQDLTRQEVKTDIITISTGNKKITLFNAKPTLTTYIDCVKVSDLIILTINTANFELETFEIISLLKAHGLCKIAIALYSETKRCRKIEKNIKKRLWKEITPGLKIYDVNDVSKLIRDILQMKYRPLEWKCSNAYVIIDKIRDTGINYELCGYLRGCPLKGKTIHVPGKGDFEVLIEELEDPCVLEQKKILDKERKIFYAPEFFDFKKIGFKDKEKDVEILDESTESSDKEFLICNKINQNDNENVLLIKNEENFIQLSYEEKKNIYKENENKIDNIDNMVKYNDLINKKFKADNEQKKDENKILNTFDEKTNNSNNESENINNLINRLKSKFEQKAEDEEAIIEKFNERYKEKTIVSEKEKRLIKEEKNIAAIKNTSAIIPGKYLKLTIKKTKDIKFDSLTIFGEVNINNKILLQGKVKKQNYFPYTLKSNERYLVSVGWRRESIKVVFSLKDPTRNKYLKYILDSLHCNVNFNNFFVEPGTSFCIIKEKQFDKEKYINNNTEDILNNYKNFKVTDEAYFTDKFFRIAACGNITDVSGKTNMLKKLKLIGYPLKINENTVFVKDMFTSDKEVIKFEGALLRTVSGIRGSIKKGVGLNGVFRATFEGRLLMSDIIFMRCFIPYEICDDYFSNENDNKDGRNINFKDCSENKDSEEKSERRKKIKINEKDLVDKKILIYTGENSENKKKMKLEKLETDLKNKLISEKLKLKEKKIIELPISPADENYNKMKNIVDEKRKIQLENEKKKSIEKNEKMKKEKIKFDYEKKQKLMKNILEHKNEKKYRKKGKKRGRK